MYIATWEDIALQKHLQLLEQIELCTSKHTWADSSAPRSRSQMAKCNLWPLRLSATICFQADNEAHVHDGNSGMPENLQIFSQKLAKNMGWGDGCVSELLFVASEYCHVSRNP